MNMKEPMLILKLACVSALCVASGCSLLSFKLPSSSWVGPTTICKNPRIRALRPQMSKDEAVRTVEELLSPKLGRLKMDGEKGFHYYKYGYPAETVAFGHGYKVIKVSPYKVARKSTVRYADVESIFVGLHPAEGSYQGPLYVHVDLGEPRFCWGKWPGLDYYYYHTDTEQFAAMLQRSPGLDRLLAALLVLCPNASN